MSDWYTFAALVYCLDELVEGEDKKDGEMINQILSLLAVRSIKKIRFHSITQALKNQNITFSLSYPGVAPRRPKC